MAAGERFVDIKPTMGPGTDKLRFSLNLTPQAGAMKRRPAIRALELGFGITQNSVSSTGTYPGSGAFTSAVSPKRLDPSTLAATQAEYDGNNGDDVYDGVSGIADFNFSYVPDTVTNYKTVSGNATHPAAVAYSTADGRYNPSNLIEEGIDVELIHGKLVCLYMTRLVVALSGALTENIYQRWSWHMPGDTRLGPNRGVWSSGVNGSTSQGVAFEFMAGGGADLYGHPVSTYYAGDESGSGHGLAGFNRPGLHAYTMASYWNKRIHGVLGSFIITGNGVGWATIAGGVVDIPFILGAGYYEADSLVLWNGLPLKMMGAPTVPNTLIDRVDPFTSIYVEHPPRNAFAHTDRTGQTVWYGFTPGDKYVFTVPLPETDVTTRTIPGDLGPDRDMKILGAYDVWYSEANNPISLPASNVVPVQNGSRAADVISLAEFSQGTIVFTKDSIQYLSGQAGMEDNARRVIHMGMGADSRWATTEVGKGVVFCNTAGIHFLEPGGVVRRLIAFDELFNDGIVIERGPYNDQQGGTGVASDDDLIYTADNTGDVFPWKQYQVDKTRLDRAVGALWGDLYILFVSRTIDDVGDDNRLALVWNWKENTFSTWLLPKNMGVRGWAYDGTLACPYVMTRYGLAMFDPDWTNDEVWVHSTSTNARNTITTGVPIPVLGQTHRFPATGAGFVVPHATVTHTVKLDDAVDDGPTEVGSALAMHIQMWTQTSEMSIARYDRNTNDIVNAKNLVLQNLYKGTFKGWRKPDSSTGDFHNRRATAGSDTDVSYRVNGAIVRTSTCRSGGHALRHRMQFFTLNHSDILSIAVGVTPVSQKGRRA